MVEDVIISFGDNCLRIKIKRTREDLNSRSAAFGYLYIEACFGTIYNINRRLPPYPN